MKFSPFELLYRRQPHGILDLVKRQTPSWSQGLFLYVLTLQDWLAQAGVLTRENLQEAQGTQARMYNCGAHTRTF